MEVVLGGTRARERPFAFIAPIAAVIEEAFFSFSTVTGSHDEDSYLGGERGFFSYFVVDAFQPVIVPFQSPGQLVRNGRVLSKTDLSVRRAGLRPVNPRSHNQIDRAFD